MSTTALTIISSALQSIGVIGESEVASGGQAADGFRRLNTMMGSWAIQSRTIPAISRSIFAVVANQGSYTFGTGGNWNAVAPAKIDAMSLVYATPVPTVEIPLWPLTDDAWESVSVKGLTSGQPTSFYFSPTFAGGLATVSLWPIPDTNINSIAVYRREQLRQFTSLVAQYDLPDGAEDAVEANLAIRLAPSYAAVVSDDLRQLARSSLAIFKRSTTPYTELANDYVLRTGSGWYDITVGNG